MIKKHYFLGTAAGFSRGMRREMRKTRGSKKDFKKLEQFLNTEYDGKQTLLTINGRSAIAAALDYFNIGEGDEVIINGFTCIAVVRGVEAVKATPVFADIALNDLNFTTETLEKVITARTKAIIVQNTLGNMVDIKAFEALCKKRHLILIEDLAHCVGRFYDDGREAGKVGDATVFSFGKEKSIDVGGGGAVVLRKGKGDFEPNPTLDPTDKTELLARIYPTIGGIYRALSYIGLNGIFMRMLLKMGLVRRSAEGDIDYKERRLGDFQAKLALEKLKHKADLKSRPLRSFYLVNRRDELLEKLKKAGYYLDGYWYECPVSPARYYKKVGFPEEACKNAVFASKHIINLPSHYSENELKPAIKIIEEYLWTGQK